MSNIRSILELVKEYGRLSDKCEDDYLKSEDCLCGEYGKDFITIDQALKEIEEAIEKEIIGENEKDEAGWNEQIRNGLRAEQKSNLKELLK